MKIRHLTAEKASSVNSFIEYSHQMLKIPHQTCVKVCSWDPSEAASDNPVSNWEIWILEEENQPAGILVLDTFRWQIDLLAVKQQFQGMGFSSELLNTARRYAKKHHHYILAAEALLSALPFFLKEGFELTSQNKTPVRLQPRFFVTEKLIPRFLFASDLFPDGKNAQAFSEMFQKISDIPCRINTCLFCGEQQGYLDALIGQSACQRIWMPEADRNSEKISYAVRGNNAILETALLHRNPDTHLLGKMILHAVSEGCRRFYIVLSELCPADGGQGMMEALGLKLQTDSAGNILSFDDSKLQKTLRGLTFIALCPESDYNPGIPSDNRWIQRLHNKTCHPYTNHSSFGHGLAYTIETMLHGKYFDAAAALLSTIGFRNRLNQVDVLVCFRNELPHPHSVDVFAKAAESAYREAIPTILIAPIVEPTPARTSGFDQIIPLPSTSDTDIEKVLISAAEYLKQTI